MFLIIARFVAAAAEGVNGFLQLVRKSSKRCGGAGGLRPCGAAAFPYP
jgi:hypothetical protein